MPRRAAIALAAAAVAALAPASASARAPQAKFRVSLEGQQTNSWTQDYTEGSAANGGCGTRRQAGGSERTSFATPAPVTVRVGTRRFEGKTIPRFKFPSGDESFKVAAEVQRASDDSVVDTCTGQAVPTDTPSCGTAKAAWWVFLAPAYTVPGHVWVGDDYRRSQNDPFEACRYFGTGFPKMLEFRDVGDRQQMITTPLPVRKLFDRKRKRIELSGHGMEKDSDRSDDAAWTTELSWKVTLQRAGR